MQRFSLLFLLLATAGAPASAQPSPYVEAPASRAYVNNLGFRPASLRSVVLPRPVPMHVETDPINATVSPRFSVAANDVSFLALLFTSNWAVANGFDLSVNLALINAHMALPTGCNLYREANDGTGAWRVPTQRELIIMYLVRKTLEATSGFASFNTSDTYWSSTQNTASTAWVLHMGTGRNVPASKSSACRVRCVRDL